MKALVASFVRAFPRAFRDQFATEMVEQINRDYDRARSRGVGPAFAFSLATALDLARAGIAERTNPTWMAPVEPSTEKKGMSWTINEWTRDLRHATRSLRRTPVFTAMAVGTLGLAIGANAGMFSVVNTVLLNPLPYQNVDRLMAIGASAPGSDLPAEFGVATEFYTHYKERSKLLEDVAVFAGGTSTLRVGDRAERIGMAWPSNTMYSALGVQPILGRLPVAEDEDRVAVISYALWQTWFGGDSAVLGQSHFISNTNRTIIGVMGPKFRFPSENTMLWISGAYRAEGITPGRFGLQMFGRVKPGTTADALASELTALSKEFPARFGGSPRYEKLMSQHRAIVRPLDEQILGGVARPLWVLLGAVGVVLMIACANVANLFMVRAEGRHRELAVRRAIGAGRGQLVRLQMSEAAVVAALAGVLAVVLAVVSLPAFLHAAPPGIPRLGDAGLSVTMLVFTLIAATLSAIACGAIPAIRGSAPDLTRLREGGRGATRGRQWMRDSLVVAQTALALVLLIGSGLLVRSYQKLRGVDPGYSTENIFTFQFAPQNAALTDGPAWARFHMDFMDRLRGLPGVQTVGLVENVPLNEGVQGAGFRTGESGDGADAVKTVNFTWAAGDYFKVMGLDVLAGRAYENGDHVVGVGNVVMTKAAANILWPGQNAVGRRIQQNGQTAWWTVVGVVEDAMQNHFREVPLPLIYFPLVGPTATSWAIGTPAYVVKTPRAEFIAPEVRALVKQVAPEAPMYRVFTMAGLARDSMVQLSFTMLTLGVVSVLALILGAVGLYGVLSYVVAQRTREIGVRMALGAKATQVRRMVVVQGTRVVLVGVAIGVVIALVSRRALGSLLFDVAPNDLTTFIGMSASMIAVGLLASYLPARRASNVDPIESLRGE